MTQTPRKKPPPNLCTIMVNVYDKKIRKTEERLAPRRTADSRGETPKGDRQNVRLLLAPQRLHVSGITTVALGQQTTLPSQAVLPKNKNDVPYREKTVRDNSIARCCRSAQRRCRNNPIIPSEHNKLNINSLTTASERAREGKDRLMFCRPTGASNCEPTLLEKRGFPKTSGAPEGHICLWEAGGGRWGTV